MAATNKVVVVGGASGIGAAVVDRFVEQGREVVVVDVVAPEASGEFIQCDLRDQTSIDAAINSIPTGFTELAYVAGIPDTHPGPAVLSVNFLALRHFLQHAVEKMDDGGAIAVVASGAGAGWPGRVAELEPLLATETLAEGLAWLETNPSEYPVYFTSKEAAILLSKRRAFDLWTKRGIRINTISPGPVETRLLPDFEATLGKDSLDRVRATVGRHAKPTDIASVITSVLSPDFGWVTGMDILVDAGLNNSVAVGTIVMAQA